MTQRLKQIAQHCAVGGTSTREGLLSGQVVIVTGGAQGMSAVFFGPYLHHKGIGEATVRLFAQLSTGDHPRKPNRSQNTVDLGRSLRFPTMGI
jgi:hypothetical protein